MVNHKITISKDKRNELKNYKQKNINELIDIYSEQLKIKEEKSVSQTVEFVKSNPDLFYVISHSGGKDSSVAYYIWEKVISQIDKHINWEINFSNTSNETADTYKLIKNLPKEKLHILNPEIGFYQWLKNKKNYFIPSIMVRNCCSTYKEGQITKAYDKDSEIVMVTGLRKHESAKRKDYEFFIDHKKRLEIHKNSNMPKKWITLSPVIDWEDVDVWIYILKENIKYNRQYELGFNRVGCLLCPYQHNYIDLIIKKQYPTYWKRWKEILNKNYEIYKIQDRLKWTLDEWIQGRWKEGISKEQSIIKNKPTKENIKELAEVKGISEELAAKYFKKQCNCGKNLNPTEVAMNLKMYGRNIDTTKMECKKCFCKNNNINSKEYGEMMIRFTEQGCNLF